MEIDSKLLFPRQVVSVTDRSYATDELLRFCYAARERDSAGRRVSNQNGGWQSESIEAGNEAYEALNSAIAEPLRAGLVGGMGVDPDWAYAVSNFWINISGPGAYNVSHIHPNSSFSGVFYVQVPADSGCLIFEDDQHRMLEEARRTKAATDATLQHQTYWFSPVPGQLLLFPATLPHRVATNRSGADRVTIAFNML